MSHGCSNQTCPKTKCSGPNSFSSTPASPAISLSQLMTTPFYQLPGPNPLSHLWLLSFSHIIYPAHQHIYWLYLKYISWFRSSYYHYWHHLGPISSYTDCLSRTLTDLLNVKRDQIAHSCAPAIVHAAKAILLITHVIPLLKVPRQLPPHLIKS